MLRDSSIIKYIPLLVANVTSTVAAVVLFLNDIGWAGFIFAFTAAVTAISVPAQMNSKL